MDTNVDDMFLTLSFLKICKMYKKLKRKRAGQFLVGAKRNRLDNGESNREDIVNKSHQHLMKQLDPDKDAQVDYQICNSQENELFQLSSVDHHTDEEAQYEISFEIDAEDGEQGHVLFAKDEGLETDAKHDDPNDVQKCYDISPEQAEFLFENIIEISEEQCQNDTDIEVDVIDNDKPFENTSNNGVDVIDNDKPFANPSNDGVLLIPMATKKLPQEKTKANASPKSLPIINPKSSAKQKRLRQFKTRPENMNRHQEGYYGNVFLNLKSNDVEQFKLLTRMKPVLFEILLKTVSKPMSRRAQHIYPQERLSLTLIYLAHGIPLEVIANKYKLGKTTARNIVLETCEVLNEFLSPHYLREPNSEEYLKIANDFKMRKLPNCVGVIDGKRVSLKNRLFILAACDSNHIFRTATVTMEPHQSPFGKAIINNTLPLPPNNPLTSTSTTEFPYYFIGNSTFPLRSNLMRPFIDANPNDKEKLFNSCISKGLTMAEDAFTILTSLWKVLSTNLDFSPPNCEIIIFSCIILHNFIMKNSRYRWHNADGTFNAELPHIVNEHTDWINDETVQYRPLESLGNFPSESNDIGHELRNILAEYFYKQKDMQANYNDV